MMHEIDHVRRCQERWGHANPEFCYRVHTWADAPFHTILAPIHRLWRHDPDTTPAEALSLFGHPAHECIVGHILDDRDSTQRAIGGVVGAFAPLFAFAVLNTED